MEKMIVAGVRETLSAFKVGIIARTAFKFQDNLQIFVVIFDLLSDTMRSLCFVITVIGKEESTTTTTATATQTTPGPFGFPASSVCLSRVGTITRQTTSAREPAASDGRLRVISRLLCLTVMGLARGCVSRTHGQSRFQPGSPYLLPPLRGDRVLPSFLRDGFIFFFPCTRTRASQARALCVPRRERHFPARATRHTVDSAIDPVCALGTRPPTPPPTRPCLCTHTRTLLCMARQTACCVDAKLCVCAVCMCVRLLRDVHSQHSQQWVADPFCAK